MRILVIGKPDIDIDPTDAELKHCDAIDRKACEGCDLAILYLPDNNLELLREYKSQCNLPVIVMIDNNDIDIASVFAGGATDCLFYCSLTENAICHSIKTATAREHAGQIAGAMDRDLSLLLKQVWQSLDRDVEDCLATCS